MFCMKCGNQMPDNAQFCPRCGTPVTAAGGAPAAPPPPPPSASGSSPSVVVAPSGVQELKCPSCGAPIKPTFGDMVVTCDYCGSSVTLGGQGWKEIQKHTMLPMTVTDRASVLKVVQGYLDAGFLHRHFLEESTLVEEKVEYVPFWVIPATASTTFQYQAVATTVGATAGTIAAGALLGSALSNRRGGFAVVPIIGGPVVNPQRSDTISGQYEYPVVAVRAMSAYQPKDYQFGLPNRTLFDKKAIPSSIPILNGDLGEDVARSAAEAYVKQLQAETVHKKHSMVSQLNTQVTVSEGELLHTPIYYFRFQHKKDSPVTVLIDGNAGKVIRTMQ
jgi:DNA-directed RNA polymerase subunit RPC12/RpoP